MDRLNGFVQVWHTSSCSTDDNNGVLEGHVTTSSDVTFTLDFPVPREFYVNTPAAAQTAPMRKRDTNKVLAIDTSGLGDPACSEGNRTAMNFTSWTSAKIADACEEYSEVSTFHGMRFVCGKHFHRIRRVIWVLLILGCLSALSLQVYNQVLYFYSNPKTVFVEQKHSSFVEFPSLTICNENSFKITAAVNSGLYEVVNSMVSGSVTMTVLEKGGMRLDEMIHLLGNHKETMLLRCKWGEDECGVDNFTTVTTDHGLCFTFNGPGSNRDLRVHTPGLSKGLQLTLNVEEYERMAGPHVASGIHILLHMKREYPLVAQFGQAVAAGSHTFVALRLKQEHRLGYPYDSCSPGVLRYVSNRTYNYGLPTCQTDCFVKYVIERCGCKDYYMPGDADVCTVADYFNCLLPALKDYPVKAEQNCQCTVPCQSEFAETTYSYAALSKSAIDKIGQANIDRILQRYKKALDVYEYVNDQNELKKSKYRAFSESLSAVTRRYGATTSILKDIRKDIAQLQNAMLDVYQIKDDYLWAQAYIVKKGFVEAKNEMDETTLGELADDLYVFCYVTEMKILELSAATDKSVKEVQFHLLKEQLMARIWLADLSLENLTQLIAAYTTGVPIFNATLPADKQLTVAFDLDMIIPRELLQKALNQSGDGANIVLSTHTHITQISAVLWKLMNISQTVYESDNITQEQRSEVRDTLEEFKEACMQYLLDRENLYDEIIDWPLTELTRATVAVKEKKDKCEARFGYILNKLDKLIEITTDTANSSLSTFIHLDTLIRDYLVAWNVTKFEVAEEFLNNVSLLARINLTISCSSIETYTEDIDNAWSTIDTCVAAIIREILADRSLKRICETRDEFMLLGDFDPLSLIKNVTDNFRVKFRDMRVLLSKHHAFQTITDIVIDDLRKFNDLAVIDSYFYSKNFIFLDVFFTDISYTVTEHQVAYDVFKLLSDIGGSMGLLVGASAISLFEFLDLFCVIATYICKGSRKMGERFRQGTSLSSAYRQR